MSITDFSVHTTADLRGCVLTVSGEVDSYTARRLRQALTRARRAGVTSITVDLAEVASMDSTGLGVLLAAHTRSTELNVPLTIRNPRPSVARILAMAGLAAAPAEESEASKSWQ